MSFASKNGGSLICASMGDEDECSIKGSATTALANAALDYNRPWSCASLVTTDDELKERELAKQWETIERVRDQIGMAMFDDVIKSSKCGWYHGKRMVNECPICYERISHNINCVTTECGHTFHTVCLMKHTAHNGYNCPCCRANMADAATETCPGNNDDGDVNSVSETRTLTLTPNYEYDDEFGDEFGPYEP